MWDTSAIGDLLWSIAELGIGSGEYAGRIFVAYMLSEATWTVHSCALVLWGLAKLGEEGWGAEVEALVEWVGERVEEADLHVCMVLLHALVEVGDIEANGFH